MPRAAFFWKNGVDLDKISSEWSALLKNLAPPFWARPPFHKKIGQLPSFGQFSENGQSPPQARGWNYDFDPEIKSLNTNNNYAMITENRGHETYLSWTLVVENKIQNTTIDLSCWVATLW